MGIRQTKNALSEEELEDYQDLTYFTKQEILLAYTRFCAILPDSSENGKNARLPMTTMLSLPELKVNPFRDRICKVFSSAGDGSMNFEDFLDMMSVFSNKAPRTIKTEYAFRIYDFDEDDMISFGDLEEMLHRLTGDGELDDDEVQQIIENVMSEADLDEDNFLAYAEFEHAVAKSPDFLSTFRIRL